MSDCYLLHKKNNFTVTQRYFHHKKRVHLCPIATSSTQRTIPQSANVSFVIRSVYTYIRWLLPPRTEQSRNQTTSRGFQILPTAIFGYPIGLPTLSANWQSANSQFCVGAEVAGSLLLTAQLVSDLSAVTAHNDYANTDSIKITWIVTKLLHTGSEYARCLRSERGLRTRQPKATAVPSYSCQKTCEPCVRSCWFLAIGSRNIWNNAVHRIQKYCYGRLKMKRRVEWDRNH